MVRGVVVNSVDGWFWCSGELPGRMARGVVVNNKLLVPWQTKDPHTGSEHVLSAKIQTQNTITCNSIHKNVRVKHPLTL